MREERKILHNIEAEKICLNALLTDFKLEKLDKMREILQPNDFDQKSLKIIFIGIINLCDKYGMVDIPSILEWLRINNYYEELKIAEDLVSMTFRVSPSDIRKNAKMVKGLSIRRSLIQNLQKTIEQIYDQSNELQLVISDAEKTICNLDESNKYGQIRTASDLIQDLVTSVSIRSRRSGEVTGIPSGIERLDYLTNGFQKSELIFIGSRPSIGKTALALSLAKHISSKEKIPCGYITLEMSGEKLMKRIIAAEGKINPNSLNRGLLSKNDIIKFTDAASVIYDSMLFIHDTPYADITSIQIIIKKMKELQGVEIIFIDYLGLIKSNDHLIPRKEQISRFCRTLKGLARELDIPIVILSQIGHFSDPVEPTLPELAEIGSIEHDADMIIFLHRSKDFSFNRMGSNVQQAELIVEKNRNGHTDKVELAFYPNYNRFEDFIP